MDLVDTLLLDIILLLCCSILTRVRASGRHRRHLRRFLFFGS